MQKDELGALTVAELKERLKSSGLPISGNKADLVQRLLDHADAPTTNRAEKAGEMSSATTELSLETDAEHNAAGLDEVLGDGLPWWKTTDLMSVPALTAVGVAVLMVTAVFVFQPAWLGFSPNYEYELIDYDAAQTRAYAEDLVSFGHPDWEGRMSGTDEEANASSYIAAAFESMGMTATDHMYQVPMHHVNSEPSLRICVQGFGGNSPCEGPLAFGSNVISFQHRVDYVIQGFSGQSA